MRELFEKLKGMAGEVTQTQLVHIMLRHKDGFWMYNNGTQYIGLEGGREVLISATPADIVEVRWKEYGEDFADFVRRAEKETKTPIEEVNDLNKKADELSADMHISKETLPTVPVVKPQSEPPKSS